MGGAIHLPPHLYVRGLNLNKTNKHVEKDSQ